MRLQDYLRVLRERWKIVAIVILLGVVGALGVFFVRPPEYTATVSLYVSAQVGDDPQQAYQGAQLSEQRVKSYNDLVTSDRVIDETISRMGLSTSPERLVSRVKASNTLDSVIIKISATDTSPVQAAAIVNTVGTVTTEVVDQLERPASPNGIAPVAVRIVQPAKIPDSPSSIGLLEFIAIGLGLGLAVGVAAALVRSALDTSIKSVDALSGATGAPNLGAISFDDKVASQPLVLHNDPHSPWAEAFRQVRTNLQFVDVDQARKVVVITSSLPAEGKTTVVANLAIAMASAGNRVLVIEADLRRPRLSKVLGMDKSVGLTSVLSGRMSMSRAIQPWGGGLFDVLASGRTPPNPSELLASNQMRATLDEARELYDVVLVDTPPLLPVTDAAAVSPAADGTVLVCRFKQTTRSNIEAASKSLEAVSANVLGTILTMVPSRGPMAYNKYNSYYSTEPSAEPASDLRPVNRSSASPAPTATTGSERTHRTDSRRVGGGGNVGRAPVPRERRQQERS